MSIVSRRLTLAWIILVGVSVLSFESSLFGSSAAGAIVIGIGLVKAAIVGSEFMEIRSAPNILRTIFVTWLLGLGAVLLSVFYTMGT